MMLMRTLRCVGAKNPLRFYARSVSTIGDALESAVEKLPYREALRLFPNNDRNVGLRLSYSELDGFVNELTNGFLELKFKKGDTIALWLPNNAENVVAQLAAAKAGLIVASIDQSISTAEELSFVINDSKAVALLFEPKINNRNNTAVVEEVLSKKTGLYTAITTATDPVDGIQLFQHVMVNSLEPHFAAQRRTQIDASTPAVVAYTSNHGQKPKRSSVLTHGDVLNKAQEIISSVKLTSKDKICLVDTPPGFSVSCVAAALKNAQLVIASKETFDEAMKLETCSIVGNEKAEFKRV